MMLSVVFVEYLTSQNYFGANHSAEIEKGTKCLIHCRGSRQGRVKDG